MGEKGYPTIRDDSTTGTSTTTTTSTTITITSHNAASSISRPGSPLIDTIPSPFIETDIRSNQYRIEPNDCPMNKLQPNAAAMVGATTNDTGSHGTTAAITNNCFDASDNSGTNNLASNSNSSGIGIGKASATPMKRQTSENDFGYKKAEFHVFGNDFIDDD